MNDSLKKINSIIMNFNNTFKLKIEESTDNEINSLSIEETIGDGKEFINEMVDLFDKVIKNSTDEYELIFNEEKGLVLAKKIMSVNYEV